MESELERGSIRSSAQNEHASFLTSIIPLALRQCGMDRLREFELEFGLKGDRKEGNFSCKFCTYDVGCFLSRCIYAVQCNVRHVLETKFSFLKVSTSLFCITTREERPV